MRIISVRENPEYKDIAINYIYKNWGNGGNELVYKDCISHSLTTEAPLPLWYLLEEDDGRIIGCVGLITNDFISRMDLYPWLCALYIEKEYRGKALGLKLINHIKKEAHAAGFPKVYLCTELVGYYEKYSFVYIGDGYHPWGDTSRIYETQSRI